MKASIFFLIIGALFSFPGVSADDHCSSFMCGHKAYVRFPFKFTNETREECGYAGFDLGCNSGENISLRLPNSGEFFVGSIDYGMQEIQVQDPDDCLPGRLMKLLSNSSASSPFYPFSGEYFKNYTFLECPTNSIETLPFSPVINCLSNATVSVTATTLSDLPSSSLLHAMCTVIATVTVPVSRQIQDQDDVVFSLSKTLTLSWKDPDCRACEAKGGVCGGGAASGDIVCTENNDLNSAWKRWQKFAKVVGFAIFLPLVVLPFFFMFVLCFRGILGRERQRRDILRRSGGDAAVAEMVQVKPGLDESVIQSYPKVVVDESLGRVLVDVMCCICLDEYVPGVTVRRLPECEHYFHVECIDKWLKVNRTCPVCRI